MIETDGALEQVERPTTDLELTSGNLHAMKEKCRDRAKTAKLTEWPNNVGARAGTAERGCLAC
jgi:hypothetical protein